MNIYTYEGISQGGQVCRGWLFSRSEALAYARLEKRSVLVQRLICKRSINVSLRREATRVSSGALRLFTQSLAALLESGMPLLGSLAVLKKQVCSPQEQLLIEGLTVSVSKGNSFSEALERFPQIFDGCYVQCVRAGEVSGSLASVLRHLVPYLERQDSLRRRIKRACAYPAAVLGVAFVVVALLLVCVVPRFERLFEDLFQGAALPYLTQCVLHVSGAFSTYGGSLFIASLAGFFAIALFVKKRGQRETLIFSFMRRIPWVGTMQRQADLARWARIQGVLMQAGVPLLRCLETSQAVVRGSYLQKQLHNVYGRVRDGEHFSISLAREGILPPLLLSFIETGEKTGKLSNQLLVAADQLETRLEERLGSWITLLEPGLIVAISLVVGTLVVALFMPMVGVLEQLTSY